MSHLINTRFHHDFVTALALDGGEVCEDKLDMFLKKYFEKEQKDLKKMIFEDIAFFLSHDPASKGYSFAQILSVRRGMVAIAAHRIFSHILRKNPEKLYEIEVLAKYVQKDTNVEIHPLANIGRKFAIDHGHGTVIGATAIIDEEVFIYHGVTLGATGKKDKTGRRHPTIGKNIFLGNGSQILGPSILEKGVSLAAGSLVADSYLSEGVKVFLNVQISGVFIPPFIQIFAVNPENPKKYWGKQKGENNAKWMEFEKFEF